MPEDGKHMPWGRKKGFLPEDVTVEGENLILVTDGDVTELEKHLKTAMPDGYRQYITRFGYGILGGS